MEALEVAKEMQIKINTIKKMRGELSNRASTKSYAVANYEKNIALTIAKLRNGIEIDFEGQKIKDPPVTIMEKLVRGICWKEKLDMEDAENMYRSLIVNIGCVESELNALQSINRYLDKI